MASYEYNKKYAEKYLSNLDEMRIRMPKGYKNVIKEHAESCGESANAFILRAIQETIERERSSAE